jgi:hypothetical protein
MNWKNDGDIGEAFVLAEAVRRGYPVSIPMGDNQRYDLVIERNNKLEKIQVRYHTGDGIFTKITCRYNKGYESRKYTKDDIDAIITYDTFTEKFYYVPSKMLGSGRNSFRLRHTPTKDGQSKKIHWAKDFEDW